MAGTGGRQTDVSSGLGKLACLLRHARSCLLHSVLVGTCQAYDERHQVHAVTPQAGSLSHKLANV